MPASFAFLIDTNSLPSSSYVKSSQKLKRKSLSIPTTTSLFPESQGPKIQNDATLLTRSNSTNFNGTKSKENPHAIPTGLRQDLKANGFNHNFQEADMDLGSEQSDMIKLIQDFILLRMSKNSLSRDKKDLGSMNDVKWAYKTFDSSQESESNLGKKFEYFTESGLNTLKKDILKDWKKNRKKGDSQENNSLFLSSALKKLLSDLSWEESALNEEQAIYIFMAVPRTNNDMLEFTNNHPIVSSNGSTKEFVHSLLPKDFILAIRKKYKIQINFVDVNSVTESFPSERDISEDYHKIIQPMLCYLNYGKLYSLLRFPEGPFGLPSYMEFLRMNLNMQSKIFEMNDTNLSKTTFLKSIPSLTLAKNKSKKSGDASSLVSKNSSFSNGSRKSECTSVSSTILNGRESTMKKARISNETSQPVIFNSQIELKTEGRYAALNKAKRKLMNSSSSTSLTSHSSSSQSLTSLPGEKEQKTNFGSLFEMEKAINKRFPSPKRVRRNLFNSQRSSGADLKTSLSTTAKLGTKFNRNLFQSKKHELTSPVLLPSPLSKTSKDSFMSPGPGSSTKVANSPSSDFIFKSPGLPIRASPRPGCSKRLSPFAINKLLTAPCRRQLELDGPYLPESPIFQKNKIICPESPITPIQVSKNGGCDEKLVIAESPETADSKYGDNDSQMNYSRFSNSFYSNGEGKRSKAWEKSGKEIIAAKMKEAMDHSSAHLSLTLNAQYSQDLMDSPQHHEPRLQLVTETNCFLSAHEETTS